MTFPRINRRGYSRSLPHVMVLGIAWLVYVGRFWLGPVAPISSFDDSVLYVAAALRLRDPGLFPSDWGFQTLAPLLEPLLYTKALALLLPFWASPEALLRFLSALLIGVFALGMFALAYELTHSVLVSLLAGLVSLRPRMAWLAEWGILMGQPLARSVIIASAPWILLWIWRTRRHPVRLIAPGIIIGLLSLIHPLSALHLGLLVLLQEILTWEGVRSALLLGTGIALGALPDLWVHGGMLADTPAPRWFVEFRNPELLPTGVQAFAGPLVYDFAVPLALAAVTWGASRASLPPKSYRWIRAGILAAALLSMGSVLAPLVPSLARFSLGRASGYIYPLLFMLVLAGARTWWDGGSAKRWAAPAVVAALALSTGAYWDSLLSKSVALAGIPLGGRVAWHPSKLPDPVPPLSSLQPEQDPAAFRELCDWIQRTTGPRAVLLAPPAGWAALRLYARRGIVVSTKDAGLLIFSAAKATAWYARFLDAAAAYADPDPAALVRTAERLGATHVVTGADRPALRLERVFANRAFTVYRLKPVA